jgi:hypothetical protein
MSDLDERLPSSLLHGVWNRFVAEMADNLIDKYANCVNGRHEYRPITDKVENWRQLEIKGNFCRRKNA